MAARTHTRLPAQLRVAEERALAAIAELAACGAAARPPRPTATLSRTPGSADGPPHGRETVQGALRGALGVAADSCPSHGVSHLQPHPALRRSLLLSRDE